MGKGKGRISWPSSEDSSSDGISSSDSSNRIVEESQSKLDQSSRLMWDENSDTQSETDSDYQDQDLIIKRVLTLKKASRLYTQKMNYKQFIPINFFTLNFGFQINATVQDRETRAKKFIEFIQKEKPISLSLQQFQKVRRTTTWRTFLQTDIGKRYSYRDFSEQLGRQIPNWNSTIVMVRDDLRILRYYQCWFKNGNKPFAICVCQAKTFTGKNVRIVIQSIHLNSLEQQMKARSIQLQDLKRFNTRRFSNGEIISINGDINFDYKVSPLNSRRFNKHIKNIQQRLNEYYDMEFDYCDNKNLILRGTFKNKYSERQTNTKRFDRELISIIGCRQSRIKKILKVQSSKRHFKQVIFNSETKKFCLTLSITDHESVWVKATIYLNQYFDYLQQF